ncbi:MAG: response regulator, partial [Oscillatoriales cyanobacterium SM2_1_8]|nr:response regulator [Oscillatoriales cyanobacterium SM2_1_8]
MPDRLAKLPAASVVSPVASTAANWLGSWQNGEEPTAAKILIVDDVVANLQLLATLLMRQGYEVRKAISGDMALKSALADPPDLILLDVRIPDVSGFEVCSTLKDNAHTVDVPVIFISALDDSLEKVEAFSVGGVDYITKPFEPVEVLARVETHLRLHQLQKSLAVRNRELQTLTTSLQRALSREKELNQLKSEFISIVSHEFRTPLTAILTAAELLEHYEWSREEQLEHFRQIQGEVNHLSSLLEDVLLMGRVESGRLAFEPAPFSLSRFCHRLVRNLGMQPRHHDRQIVIVWEGEVLRDDLPLPEFSVVMDEKLLRQIFTNLLSNALKYSPPQSTIEFEVEFEAGQQGAIAVFWVRDAGCGIPFADQKNLFTPFYRARNVSNIQGTGLGLSIVVNCVEAHGGTLTALQRAGWRYDHPSHLAH